MATVAPIRESATRRVKPLRMFLIASPEREVPSGTFTIIPGRALVGESDAIG